MNYGPIYMPIYGGPGPSAPVVGTAPAITGTPKVGTALTTTPAVWSGVPEPTVTRVWEKSTNGGSTWTPISGATGLSYTPVAADAGATIRVTETATNDSGTASSSSAATTAVTQTPANTAVPTITGTAQVGQVLTATNGTWTGNPTPTYSRKWQKSTNGSTWTDIAGATATTYTPVAGDVGATIRVAVTATNAAGSASANSAATAAVIAAA